MTLESKYDLLKKAFYVVCGLLVVALVAILILWLSLRNERQQSERFESMITSLERNDERLTAKIGRMESKIASDSITASRTIAKVQVGITNTISKMSRLRSRIGVDSVTVAHAALGDLVELQFDTLVATQSEAFKAQVLTLRQIIALERAKNSNKDSILIGQASKINTLTREKRKEHNGKVFWKCATIAAFLFGAFEASQN